MDFHMWHFHICHCLQRLSNILNDILVTTILGQLISNLRKNPLPMCNSLRVSIYGNIGLYPIVPLINTTCEFINLSLIDYLLK